MNVASEFFDTRTRNWRARLAISAEFMRELSRHSDPHVLSQIFIKRMNQLFPTAKQLTLSRRGVDKPAVRVTRFSEWTDTPNPITHWAQFPVLDGGLLSDLLYVDEPTLLQDAVFADDDPATQYLHGQRSILAIPIYEHGIAQNTIVVSREEPNAFPPEQIPELVWMTNLFGRATQSLSLSQRLRDAYEATDAEIREIAELQQSLLPTVPPRITGLDVTMHYQTVHRAGGDYYDFFALPHGCLGVLIADVSGHGTPAAVLMAITHSIAHAAAATPDRPGAFLTHLNANLAGRYNRHSASFVTAFAAVFDPANHRVTYASAGHVPPRLVRANGQRELLNDVQRLPLGISPAGVIYPEKSTVFAEGDQVLLFTDGLTDAANATGDVYGSERLDEVLASASAMPVAAILADIDRFIGGPPNDDRTAVLVRRLGGCNALPMRNPE